MSNPLIPQNIPRRDALRKLENSTTYTNATDVVVYIRVSTEKQENSPKAQNEQLTQHAEEKGLTIHKTFIDAGTSASKEKYFTRKVVKEMLHYMRKNNLHKIRVSHPDRAFRSVSDSYRAMEDLEKENIHLIFASPEIDTSTPMGRMGLTFIVQYAEHESKQISRRVTQVTDHYRKNRRTRTQNAPYGWKSYPHPTEKTKSGRPALFLEPVPDQQRILTQIFNLYQAGNGLTFQAIADELNLRGIKTKMAGRTLKNRGKEYICKGLWFRNTVRSVIEHADIHEDYTHLLETTQKELKVV